MNQDHIAQNLNKLHKRRADLLALENSEKDNALLKSGKQATGDVGDTDLGADLAEQDIALKLTGMESVEIARIDAAVERANQGHYGICEFCGKEISANRLALVPEAAYCAKCDTDARHSAP